MSATREPSGRSLRGLDGLNFLMADVRDGLGPYLSIFLKGSQHWGAGEIGLVMAVGSIATAICQVPAGLLVDALRIKRAMVAGSGLIIAICCLLIGFWPTFPGVVAAQVMLGAAVCLLIDPRDIDDDRARGGETAGADGTRAALPLRDLLRRRDLLVFLAAVVLFHFGNAAMLPLAGQVLARKHPGSDAISLSACIIAAQFVMIGVAWAVGRALRAGFGRKSIFLVALAVLPVRGVLFSFVDFPVGVVAIQLLDGVAAGIFGVISVIIAADLMQGTGRFNLAQGLVALAVGIGAGLSNLVSGYIVEGFGYPAGFLSLAAIAVCALVFFLAFMPETAPRDDGGAPGEGLAANLAMAPQSG
jgi:MFS family permease